MKFQPVKGMPDILPDELPRWQRIETAVRRCAELHGFGEVRTPLLEPTDLYRRSTGESSEIVEKQMFTIERGGKSLSLRPEGTPSCARAYIGHSVFAREPVTRWFYLGPMFRAENVQRGRQRQFHQAGFEVYGDPGPACDAELVDMLSGLFAGLGIKDVQVRINSLGGPTTRARYQDALLQYLRSRSNSLSQHARDRLEKNPLRVLDSKHPDDQTACAEAPEITEVMTDDDRVHFRGLTSALDALGTPYRIDSRLVRGLDYYTRTVFEVSGSGGGLGSQDALAAGGRYDDLLEGLGSSKPLPGIGFAIGLERVLLAMPDVETEVQQRVLMAPLSEAATERALVIAKALRADGIRCQVDGRSGSLKAKLRRANAMGARLCLLLGDDELARGVVTLKDLGLREQEEVVQDDLGTRVRACLARPVQGLAGVSN